MGAEGQIRIIARDKLLEAWPDGEDLAQAIPNCYTNTIDGIKYWHIYWGDNLCVDPFNVSECFIDNWPQEQRERLKDMLAWWEQNAEWWEVWT